MRFFFGLHHPSDAKKFGCCFISVNALRPKQQIVGCGDWILDSGAFSEISRHGEYRESVAEYAAQIVRWTEASRAGRAGRLLAAVSQDYMCEPLIVEKTGLSVLRHQQKSIERYDALLGELRKVGCETPILPVLQGYAPSDYARHVEMYGERLDPGAWVGLGSVCKRNGSLSSILDVLGAVHDVAPGFRLHGFGLKTNALQAPVVRALLYSADSMAWSFHARKQGRDGNDPREAMAWARKFGVDLDGLTRETWRTIGINDADDGQTPRELWRFEEPTAEVEAA